MLGGQLGVNDIASGDDPGQLRGDRGPGHGDPVRHGKPEPGSLGGASGSGGRDAVAREHQRSAEPRRFVELAYSKSDWTAEKGEEARRGFVAAVQQGWDNADGSQQSITLVRFATPAGAMSAFDEVRSGWETQHPDSLLTDSATGAVGWSTPALDSQGNADAEWGVAVGDSMILVVEYTAATPDPAAAKALLLQQYDRLKNVS